MHLKIGRAHFMSQYRNGHRQQEYCDAEPYHGAIAANGPINGRMSSSTTTSYFFNSLA